MDGNKMVDFVCATIGVKCYAPTDMGMAYHYELTVPNLLSKDQMELILRMISKMKREQSTPEPVRFLWRKDET